MRYEDFINLLDNFAKNDEENNMYVYKKDIYGATGDDEEDFQRYYFSLSTTVCSDMLEYCDKCKNGYELSDRHFIDDDTLKILIVKEND